RLDDFRRHRAQHSRRDEGQDADRDSRRARHPFCDRGQRQPLIMRRAVIALALLLVASCSSRQSLFVVLPNPDGSSGAVTIEDAQKSVVLDQPYAAGEVRGGIAAPVNVDQAQVQQIFGNALAAQPVLPSHFVLYFEKDSDVLTPKSKVQYQDVFSDIKRRNVYEVEVIGHTDTLGKPPYNQQLSMSR